MGANVVKNEVDVITEYHNNMYYKHRQPNSAMGNNQRFKCNGYISRGISAYFNI